MTGRYRIRLGGTADDVMAIPAIGAAQALQWGATAAALGPPVARGFGELLKAAGNLLAPEPPSKTSTAPNGTPESSDLGVLRQQIQHLVAEFNQRLRLWLQGSDEESGTDLEAELKFNDDGSLRLPEHPSFTLDEIISDDPELANLLRQIVSRQRLLESASPVKSQAAPRETSLRNLLSPGAVPPGKFSV